MIFRYRSFSSINTMKEDLKLNSSKLGTKEYWDAFYRKEINNYQLNPEDTGECWFEDSDAESKMIQFIVTKVNESQLVYHDKLDILDLGTGNGHLLFTLHKEIEEECDNLTDIPIKFKGVDYSQESVDFASRIAYERFQEGEFVFECADLLAKNDPLFTVDKEKYEILLDKGTLDAIALNQKPVDSESGKLGVDIYVTQVCRLMHRDSILLITSCNFTESELIEIITSQISTLKVWDRIDFPTFKFGGAQGATICTVAFIKE